jgi:hypothetical protein
LDVDGSRKRMENRYRDFDAFEKERQQIPVTFTMRGQRFELPADLPALALIRIVRLQAESSADAAVTAKMTLELLALIFPEGELDRLLATGLSAKDLGKVLEWLVSQYLGGGGEEPRKDQEGNAPAPAKAGEKPPAS